MIIPVLMYHSVEPVSEDYLTVSTDVFEEHLRLIKDRFTAISAAAGAQAVKGAVSAPENPIIITFDDGFTSVYQHAVPLLSRYGLGATFFIVGSAIGGNNLWDHKAYRILPHMDCGEILDLHKAGYEIGSHTYTHQRFTKLSDEMKLRELDENDRVLAEITGRTPQILAYPYGGVDEISARLCRERYAACLATVHCGVFHWEENMGMIRRIYVSPDDSATQLEKKITDFMNGVYQ